MELCSIASGSSGNCIYAGTESSHLMIDAGISGKRIEAGLNSIGLKTAEMQALLVTHEHSDHISGLGVVARKYGIPIYATAETIEAVKGISSVGKVDETLFHPIEAGVEFQIGDITVEPVSISHDAANPVAYIMKQSDKKMAVIMSLHELDLAQKVSDTIACVRGDRIDRVGTPEEIFAGNYVQELYGVADQSFDPVTGQIFLCTGHEKAVVSRDFSAENCSGKNFGCGKKNPDPVSPQFFVIGGAGSGIPVYNRLWRENIPFAAGILQENDVEYKAAVALASEVVSEKAFYPVGQDKVQAAKRLIESCKKCICAVEEFGPLNEANRELAEYARRIGKTGKNI